ncbi:hypothetical protein AAF712_009651 [Marasmius tenuissimus]|uniref:Uncharacterized protein n=1 Tax=Marasmius tenuissimus TaxID=585030 RepID=A0ABR2ZSZ2_9AGAR|nr:hypothetical protein PM082_015561 [Marasmius tenuissimus]
MQLPLSRLPAHSESLDLSLQDLSSDSESDPYNHWVIMKDLERTNNMLAHHQAPLNVADGANIRLHVKYNGDYRCLLIAANVTINSNYPLREPQFPIPSIFSSPHCTFSVIVLHVFIRCVCEVILPPKSPFRDLRLPPPTSWSTIFPAYSTLETHRDAILSLGHQSRYLTEASNPGITSLFVLPFLEMLKERKDDPLAILAVHMQVLSHVQDTGIRHDSSWDWVWDGRVCTEEMEDFLESQEITEWFDSQPRSVREECEKSVQEMKLVTRKVRMRNALALSQGFR